MWQPEDFQPYLQGFYLNKQREDLHMITNRNICNRGLTTNDTTQFTLKRQVLELIREGPNKLW